MESFLEYNRNFVADKQYERYTTSKYPDRNVAIVACMDTDRIIASGIGD